MAKKEQTIVIKKVQGGHGGAHGGAWKVAFADFMTAMMAFFLVLWLMGSDEETKSAVADYFNNPTSAWRKDLTSKETAPLGDKTGAGQNLLKGAGQGVPEDMVKRPSKPNNTYPEEGRPDGETADYFLDLKNNADIELVRFSIPEAILFEEGTTDQWAKDAEKALSRVGDITKKQKGTLLIEGKAESEGSSNASSYEFTMSRVVQIQKYLVSKKWASEDSMTTKVQSVKALPAGSAPKITFTFTKE